MKWTGTLLFINIIDYYCFNWAECSSYNSRNQVIVCEVVCYFHIHFYLFRFIIQLNKNDDDDDDDESDEEDQTESEHESDMEIDL